MDYNLKEYHKLLSSEKFTYYGLDNNKVVENRRRFGSNSFGKKKKISLFKRILSALSEPMILILLFACVITVGINIGNMLAGKEYDFYECIGIIGAISLSVGLTVFMEGKSEKAFETLQKLNDNIAVTVIRDGERRIINYSDVVVGDILICEAGDKVTADGLVIECNDVECDESNLSGESRPENKSVHKGGKIYAENMLFSGTYLMSGYAKILVLAVGEKAQIGKIAKDLSADKATSAPLTQKLNSLSKKISIFGGVASALTFILTLLRMYLTTSLTFESAKEAFIEAVVLIVASVPEGLPATVAIALALSVVKLAKSNVVIKKLIAAETAGCVSVICSDKTGTLTMGKMEVDGYYYDGRKVSSKELKNRRIIENITYNSTAYYAIENNKVQLYGNSTERALLKSIYEEKYIKLKEIRERAVVQEQEPFLSKRKYMTTTVKVNGAVIKYVKGSIEKIVERFNISGYDDVLKISNELASQGSRVIAFAHDEGNGYVLDGIVSISDIVRDDVYKSIKQCKKAGISIKILTGDNKETAIAIAKKIGVFCKEDEVLTGAEIHEINDERLKEIISRIKVIARSTPETKLRVVKILKELGEIVAVTGDGVNDAPAVKHADIGISMGDGSEITKEASDVILLDNSFSVIVKALSFGRNIYRNFQRFLFFQLTVNFSAVGIIVVFLLLGYKQPFSALQLLWINIIMDGPLALSLGLEHRDGEYMEDLPVKRSDSIVSKKMFLRIIIHSIIIVSIVLIQKLHNVLKVLPHQVNSAIFCLFILLQLFNAINAREIGVKSIFLSLMKNKLFSVLFAITLIAQFIISEYLCVVFGTSPLGFLVWLKLLLLAFTIVLLSESYKMGYRIIMRNKLLKKIIKRRKFA